MITNPSLDTLMAAMHRKPWLPPNLTDTLTAEEIRPRAMAL